MKGRILVVDDDSMVRKTLVRILKRAKYTVTEAESGRAALSKLEGESIDLVLTDLRMSGMSGEQLLQEIRKRSLPVDVMVMTGFPTIESAVHLMQLGAGDYITKPFHSREILIKVARIFEHRQLSKEVSNLRAQFAEQYGTETLVGESPAVRRLRELILKVADSKTTVLITGESGTGKGLVARIIHANSVRMAAPFQTIDCGALTASLEESELFGYAKGAFTGADRSHTGLVVSANGGTLFLDEIGEMPLSLQVKFLRILEERRVRPIGDEREIEVDVRVISATHRNLGKMVAEGKFREDLLYRLCVVQIDVAPLRERLDDIPLLVRRCLHGIQQREGHPVEIEEAAFTPLLEHHYPGNVRELFNLVEYCAAMADDKRVTERMVREALARRRTSGAPPVSRDVASTVAEAERTLIQETLARHTSLITAAEELGISRTTLWRRMRKHKISWKP